MLWKRYPKEEASWVSEENITSAAIRLEPTCLSCFNICSSLILIIIIIILSYYRSFETPTPSYRVIADATSNLTAVIQKSLKSGVNCNNRLDLEFRTDVFKVLFDGKGKKPPNGQGLFYDLNDFDKTYFKDNWYVAYDKLGNGCSIHFPIRLEGKIRWSPKIFYLDGTVKPRIFSEIIYVTLVKIRC